MNEELAERLLSAIIDLTREVSRLAAVLETAYQDDLDRTRDEQQVKYDLASD